MECPHCMGKIEPWVYRLPRDASLLAATLGLPTETVCQMIANESIPVRVSRDSLGRRRSFVVLIHDALEGLRGSQSDTQ
jgi:hypothetical protein